jgi:hypothetical protein
VSEECFGAHDVLISMAFGMLMLLELWGTRDTMERWAFSGVSCFHLQIL